VTLGTRIERLAAGLDLPLLVTKAANVRYLSGLLDSSNAMLLVDPTGDAVLYTDFRYADAARALPEVSFTQTQRAVTTSLAPMLSGRSIAVDPDHVSHTTWEALRGAGVEVTPLTGRVEALRSVKDDGEISAIRRAAELSDVVYAELAEDRFTGRTERELAWQIDRRFRELGAEASAFDTMVGAGEMGARPHGEPRDVPIPAGTMVVVDTGCVVDGYRSDCTRTFLTGEDERLADLYALCLQAQLDGLAAVRPGAAGKDVDAASRVAIGEAGLAERFGHGLGHGVGLEIHEGPNLRPESADVLEVGNVVTVEPGIYLDGDVGVRIEDLVLVTADGHERLTTFTKDPIVVS
jgi:Xaa-Pro aminopeptidase